jgi:hypothetical protein
MGISRVRSTVLTISLAAAVAGAGCGGTDSTSGDGAKMDKDVAAILAKVQRDLAKVKSLHIEVTVKGKSRMAADVFASGQAALNLTDGAAKARVLLLLPSAVYIKGNRAYWEAGGGSALAGKVSGRWVKAPPATGKALKPVVEAFTPKRLAECTYTGSGTLSVKGTDTIDGQKVVVLRDAGDKPGAIPGLSYVTTRAPYLPLRAVSTGKRRPGGVVDKRCQTDKDPGAGEVMFSRFDTVPEITVPKGAIDLQDLAAQNAGSIA